MATVTTGHAYVVRKPGVCGGRPTIRGTRIPVSSVAFHYNRGETVEEMIEAWPHITASQIHDALSFYYDHQKEIDDDIALELDEEYWMSRYPPGKGIPTGQ